MRKGSQIDAVCADFCKAFDRVNHQILIRKSYNFGISGSILNWLQLYILGRSHFVKYQSRMPQSSHLGPLLFNKLISDLSRSLPDSLHLVYADNLKFYHTIHSHSNTVFFQSKPQSLEQWCNRNNLYLNVN